MACKDGRGKSLSTGIRTPNRPARSKSPSPRGYKEKLFNYSGSLKKYATFLRHETFYVICARLLFEKLFVHVNSYLI